MALVKLRLDPTPREQRQFAALWFPAFFALLGGLFLYSGAPLVPVLWVWGVVAALSLAALASATFARSLFAGWMLAAFPIGWVVSHLILGAIYYGVISPTGLLMRAFSWDPLTRGFDAQAETYWVSTDTSSDPEHYLRQF